jgi:pimeloyl-ACP methyl ester carboxylesterase
MNDPQNFEISQQSRDAVAVLRQLGETSALVFGNSSGAVIALDLAKTQPDQSWRSSHTNRHSRACIRGLAGGNSFLHESTRRHFSLARFPR